MKYVGIICVFLSLFFGFKKDQISTNIDPLQYPKGYNDTIQSVIKQLSSYPLPRYFPSNNLLHLFNWMDPFYMGGRGQKGLNNNTINLNSVAIQKELSTNWHYGIVIANACTAFYGVKENECPLTIQLANQNPEIPLHVITFWLGVSPKKAGYPYKRSAVMTQDFDSSLYVNYMFNGKKSRSINFIFPDSLIQIDGRTQKYYLQKIINSLTRPIDVISENGEEPPGPYLLSTVKKDPVMAELKKKMGDDSWEVFLAKRKLHLRNTYSSCFMNEIPELKNTQFSFYTTEGGPVDRFDWGIMKTSIIHTNNMYYSTPDYYPRWPRNWRDGSGPWHGWKWIEFGRQNEIKQGDNLFSPFVAAGWSKVQEEDIRPSQWLGLLKCLGGIGAEFYYVGYFNLSAPFTDPAKWAWQAIMPSYAQAITSRFEDVLKNGNVLFDEKSNPIISYYAGDKNSLVTVRKHKQKEKYIICGTYQPYSNNINELPEKKNATITIVNHELSFEIRKQGSVYVYEKTPEGKVLFYQLDSWHENAHPDHWTKDFYFEAEVADTVLSNKHLFTINEKGGGDYTNFITYLSLSKNIAVPYKFTQRDSSNSDKYLWIKYKGDGDLSVTVKNIKVNSQNEKLPGNTNWKWHKIKFKTSYSQGSNTLTLQLKTGSLDIDKLVITENDKTPTH